MKRALALLTILLLIFSLTDCGSMPEESLPLDSIETYKDIPGVGEDEISDIEALKAVWDEFTYGVPHSTEAFILSDGSPAGFSAKFCELLSDLFGIRFVMEIHDQDELTSGLEDLTLDFIGGLIRTEENARTYDVSLPISERLLRIFYHEDSEGINTETDIERFRIGFLKGSTTADSVRRAYPVSFTSVEVADHRTAADMIERGEIYAFVDDATADTAFDEYDFIRSKIFFQTIHQSVSMATANPELEPIISVISKYIDAGGVDKLYSLYKEGDYEYAKYKLNNSFTSEERAYIENWKRLGTSVAVACEHDNYPIVFYNEATGKFEGIALDILDEISGLTGIKFAVATSKNAVWADIIEETRTGNMHMVTQLLYTDAKRDQFLWSAVPYAYSSYVIMSRFEYPNLERYQIARATVGVARKSGHEDIYRELFPNNNNLVEYDTFEECLDALERGDVDLLMASEHMMLNQTNYREKPGFKINMRLNVPMNSYFGFPLGERVLCSIIDKAQQYVHTDVIEMNWTGRSFDYLKKLAETRVYYMMFFVALLLMALAATAFLLVKNVRLGKRLKEMANTDALTGIFNRRFFMELASIQIARSVRTGISCFIIIFDLDHFKSVNDNYGHLAGDKVLHEVAQRVKKVIRPYDLFGRYGGEEFIIFMTDLKEPNNKSNVINATERIRLEVCREPVIFESKEIQVSASFGVACVSPVNDIHAATRRADESLYRAKQEGRNRIVFYDDKNA